MNGPFPRFRPVAEQALLVEFGETIDDAIHARVLRLDAALSQQPFEGLCETVPAYASLLVRFDPLRSDHALAEAAIRALLDWRGAAGSGAVTRDVAVCYDADLAPDLPEVARQTGLDPDQVIAAHLAGDYRIYMYGFAPGYAYMAGVPEAIRLPRKPAAQREIPAGSVMIAGPQCLVTTLAMPSGWWVIGRSPTPILTDDPARPFLFDVGDRVRFRRISRDDLDRGARP